MTPFAANLARRVATAAVAIPLILAVLFLGPSVLAVALVALVVALGTREFHGLLAARGLQPLRLSGWVVTALLFWDVAFPEWQWPPLVPLAAVLLLGATLARAGDLTTAVPAAAGTLLGALYLGGLGGTMAGLRTLEPVQSGPWRLVLLLGIVMGSDVLAFFTGHAMGGHKLAPAISPGKTVEGGIGGLIGGILGSLTVRWIGLASLPVRDAIGLGLMVAASGIVGDLFESVLKRWAGVKDSGALFPGHGGMLDRLDSLLFGAPVLYYYFVNVG